MTTVFVRRFMADYARNPINLILLVVVPTVFVVVVAGSMADAAKLVGGVGGPAVETATAGWAAAFLAGIAMYFQTAATRDTDRRVVIAGLPANRLVAARLITGTLLAALASAAAVVALAVRTGVDHPGRAIVGTFMFALIYVAIGAVVGSIAGNPVNGTVIVMFVWIIDVFFGPAMGAADRVATRGLPTHFVTLWMVDLPSRHGGRLGDLGWALAWTVTAVAAAWVLAGARTRVKSPRSRLADPAGLRAQLAAAGRAAWRDARRNRVQWVLFVVVPVVFILAADAVTPNKPITLTLQEHGHSLTRAFAMPAVHGATMAPIAIASLAALVGLFVLLDSRDGDRRSVLAGLRPGTLFGARLGVLALMALAATVVSLATTALVFQPTRWFTYAAANLLLAFTYALVGALLGPLFGRVGGVFIAFLLPFLDLGITQSPMLHAEPTTFSRLLPGYGGSRVLLDGALTSTFDQAQPLLIGVAWLVTLGIAVALIYRHATMPSPTMVRAASADLTMSPPSQRPT
ncbi:ABC transporter permease [Knoellia locipacati]|uniref:ABC transporter permease n=1 Tax=Knoellia locipacati TaxID=882824 RepID=UPI00384FC2C4